MMQDGAGARRLTPNTDPAAVAAHLRDVVPDPTEQQRLVVQAGVGSCRLLRFHVAAG